MPSAKTETELQPLIVSNEGDRTADWLILELEKRDVRFLRLNTEDFPLATGLSWTPSGERALQRNGRCYPLALFRSVWYRRPIGSRVQPTGDAALDSWGVLESRETLEGLWRTHEAEWVNHPDANRMAEAKLEQLQRAKQLGFGVPDTLVSNDPERLREFWFAHSEGVICKPLRTGRVEGADGDRLLFTSEVSLDALAALSSGFAPTMFQALVPKAFDIRITVIGSDLFGVSIDSQSDPGALVDWRRRGAALRHRVHELPSDIADLCVALVRSYGLRFGAIDLVLDPGGRYTFLS